MRSRANALPTVPAEASNNATVATREAFIGGKLRSRVDER